RRHTRFSRDWSSDVCSSDLLVINAFLAAEDKTFYEHSGIDIRGIVRAAVTNFRNMGGDRRPEGASTITQQVAKNFLLSNEVSIEIGRASCRERGATEPAAVA